MWPGFPAALEAPRRKPRRLGTGRRKQRREPHVRCSRRVSVLGPSSLEILLLFFPGMCRCGSSPERSPILPLLASCCNHTHVRICSLARVSEIASVLSYGSLDNCDQAGSLGHVHGRATQTVRMQCPGSRRLLRHVSSINSQKLKREQENRFSNSAGVAGAKRQHA